MFGLNCSLKQKLDRSTQNEETTSQRRSWWDPTSLYAERVREPSQHSQRKSLRKRVWQLKESSETFKLFALVWKFVGLIQCNDGINATTRTSYVLVRWSTLLTVTRLGSVTKPVCHVEQLESWFDADKLRFFHVFCTSFGVPACQKQASVKLTNRMVRRKRFLRHIC